MRALRNAGRRAFLAAIALGLAACAAEPPQRPQPAFYVDLARPGASLDPGTATEIINAYRERNGRSSLAWDSSLHQQAEREAQALAARDDLLENRGSLNTQGQTRQTLWRSVSGGYHSFADAFSGWRGSPAHNAVLLVPDGRQFAIAAVARPGSRHRVYWVMLVSAR